MELLVILHISDYITVFYYKKQLNQCSYVVT